MPSTSPKPVRTRAPPTASDWRSGVRKMARYLKYYRAVFTDKRTPRRAKILLGIALAYVVSPFDLIPDFIPFLGQLDDAFVVPFLFNVASRQVPDEVKDHWRRRFGLDD
jgi:uncharacterized membrane protein YkvA (DUF1232 family)